MPDALQRFFFFYEPNQKSLSRRIREEGLFTKKMKTEKNMWKKKNVQGGKIEENGTRVRKETFFSDVYTIDLFPSSNSLAETRG